MQVKHIFSLDPVDSGLANYLHVNLFDAFWGQTGFRLILFVCQYYGPFTFEGIIKM